ncbi:hypothetical protein HLB44_08685 [Aquincola sp. S2]|uniref:Uncharacterized protein n=1 Tax=Pseudaquabacterium terrae TaxID=2732868 RepID=A0ABX2EEK4_9BURK|nr:hypothetical protein [Aquabacterium terrae]NRF67055.1 hypothetical protein [Aquabacterium terrae]
MRQLLGSELAVRPLASAGPDDEPKCELLRAGAPTGCQVFGAVLEAAILWNDRTLLFMTDGIPYEDFLTIHLFDDRLSPLDSASIGTMFSTGSFSLLRLDEPNRVVFRFIGDTAWTVELLEQPVLQLPLLGDPPGVQRRLRLQRHFRLHTQPRHQAA